MNEQLAHTLGIEFVRKKSRTSTNCDVKITKVAKNRYSLSFSKNVASKLGDHIRIAPTEKRLYIASGCNDSYGYKVRTSSKGARPNLLLAAASVGFIDRFIGEHELVFYEDLDAYYITAKGADK